MNLEQMRARLGQIVAKLNEFQNLDSFEDETVTEINALNDEFVSLKKNIETKEKLEAMSASSNAPVRKTASEATTPVARIEVGAPKNNGFKSFGEFLASVKKAAGGEMDKRFTNTMTTSVDAEGGFLVPDEFMTDVTKRLESDESLLAKTKQFVVSSNNLTLPKDESQPWTGGVQASWLGENAQYTATTPNTLSEVSFKLSKLGALIHITDELISDSVALESYIRGMAPASIMHKINEAIISGNGIGKPSGLLSSTFRVTVPKEVGQVADSIVARNVIKMYSRMLPASRGAAVWYMNAGCEEQLRGMVDDNGNFIYLAPGSQMNQSPYGLLLGRPVMPMIGSLPQLGDEGDIIFADLSYYYTIVKSGGMKQAVSSHLKFDYDVQSFKFTMRLDGKVPFATPVTTQYGAYTMSGIVTLAARA
jgi:HK97 family phage major capsid protein